MTARKNRSLKNKYSKRVTVATAFALIAFFVFILDLISVQIVHGEEYSSAMKSLSTYKASVDASRGEIFDRNGNPLVTNRTGYSLVFDLSYFPSSSKEGQSKRNEIIISLIRLLESKGEIWTDELPLAFNEKGNIEFLENRENDIAYLKTAESLNHYATAKNCFNALVERYGLSEYDKEDARKIASVCHSMRRVGFSMSTPYTFATDISIETAAYVKENSDFYQGVEISIETYREYADGSLAPHLVGNVGAISAEEYTRKKDELDDALNDPDISDEEKEILKANEYKLNDTIGKFGVEQAMEEYLRGKSGTKAITVDVEGNVSSEYTVSPETGNTVILTIDRDLQLVTQQALEKRIKELAAIYGFEAAGACVVIDVNTGEILASASYPSYDLSTYMEDYDELASSPGSPLWNRAFQSTYQPGSTMKPGVALAALETGAIDEKTSFLCEKTYDKYKDRNFDCLDYHGYLNVVSAIDKSCNIFFYKTAEILGINTMNTYSSLLGLGSKTGVELAEASGVLASVAYSNSISREWNPGDTVQAAIGQSYNLFTPLQLANYCATIANGGTRYTPYIVKSVKSFDYSETILDKTPQIATETGISAESLELVKQGMKLVGTTGFCKEAFANLPVKAGAKTGTAQVTKYLEDGTEVEGNNGLLITFAPYDEPEIAIAVIIENVNGGAKTANVAADIYDFYFNRTVEMDKAQSVNDLLR